MGYRSELYAIVGLVDVPEFERLLKETDLTECFDEISKSDLAIEYQASDLKWYDGYAEVERINALFNTSTFSILLRTGEEYGDTEYYTNNNNLQQLFNIQTCVDTTLYGYDTCFED